MRGACERGLCARRPGEIGSRRTPTGGHMSDESHGDFAAGERSTPKGPERDFAEGEENTLPGEERDFAEGQERTAPAGERGVGEGQEKPSDCRSSRRPRTADEFPAAGLSCPRS